MVDREGVDRVVAGWRASAATWLHQMKSMRPVLDRAKRHFHPVFGEIEAVFKSQDRVAVEVDRGGENKGWT